MSNKTISVSDYFIAGTKLPTIPDGISFSTNYWLKDSPTFRRTDNGRTIHGEVKCSDLYSYGLVTINGTRYLQTEGKYFKGENFFLFAIDDFIKIIGVVHIGYKLTKIHLSDAVGKIIGINHFDFKNFEKYITFGENDPNAVAWKGVVEKLNEAGVLDLWFEKVYQEGGPKLPTILGYEGELHLGKGFVTYGCADIDFELIEDLVTIGTSKPFKGNRSIKSVTLDSGKTITIEQLKQIKEYLEYKRKTSV